MALTLKKERRKGGRDRSESLTEVAKQQLSLLRHVVCVAFNDARDATPACDVEYVDLENWIFQLPNWTSRPSGMQMREGLEKTGPDSKVRQETGSFR